LQINGISLTGSPRCGITRRSAPLYVARAELSQGGQVKATACGKFMEMSR
jgi:hypothetical protein